MQRSDVRSPPTWRTGDFRWRGPAAVLLLVQLCACAAQPMLPAEQRERRWEPMPELSDEFEQGTLDTTKWYDHVPMFKGRPPALNSPVNVSVSGGKLHLTTRVEHRDDFPKDFHTFTTAALMGKVLIRYGYFEIKARAMKARVSSGFWFYHITPSEWTEIDVFEICGAGGDPLCTNAVHMHVHVFRTPREERHWKIGSTWKADFDPAADYHVYGLEWNEEAIRWYIDGKLVRETKNTHWHQPLFLILDAETQPDWFGLPSREELPARFSIEYVRAWRIPEAAE